MLIQCDVDGVLADFTGGCLKVMRGMGFHFTHEDVVDWDISSLLHEEQRPEFWCRVKLPEFCFNLELLPSASAAVLALLDAKHDVRFLTSAMPGAETWKDERRCWVFKHFYPHWLGQWGHGFTAAELPVIFTHDKHLHGGDILIDDKPEHVEAWLATNRPAILVDHPYNRGVNLLAPRARDISHAAELVLARSW